MERMDIGPSVGLIDQNGARQVPKSGREVALRRCSATAHRRGATARRAFPPLVGLTFSVTLPARMLCLQSGCEHPPIRYP